MAFDIAPKIEEWSKRLLDTTRRNRLINSTTGGAGGLDLLRPSPGDIWKQLVDGKANSSMVFTWKRDLVALQGESDPDGVGSQELERCLKSRRLRPNMLLTELTDKQLATRLGGLRRKARESLNEQGVPILFLAFGFLRWCESESSKAVNRSPLLLVPATLWQDSSASPYRLTAEQDEILPNFTLAERLRGDFRVVLPDYSEDCDGHEGYLRLVRQAVRAFPSWAVEDGIALGTFSYQKLAMWEDLKNNHERIGNHKICRAIGGDRSAPLAAHGSLVSESELDDKTNPETTYHILDADSSQHAAIAAVTGGADLVLDGPPGTGKSQTIANVIAEFLAAGKTVLFVSEKTAALEVVKRRLDDCGLGDYCLELHSHKANKKTVVEELHRCLNLKESSGRNPAGELRRLRDARNQLNDYVRELHRRREPLGTTVFEVNGEMAALGPIKPLRCKVQRVGERDEDFLRKVTVLLDKLPSLEKAVREADRHPWRGSKPRGPSTTRDDVAFHLGRLSACFPDVIAANRALAELGFGNQPNTVSGLLDAATEAKAVLGCPKVPAGWFATDPVALANTVLELDAAARRSREIMRQSPELAAVVVRQSASADLMRVAAAIPNPTANPSNAKTAKGRLDQLTHMLDRLARMQASTEVLRQAQQQFVKGLNVNLTMPAVGKTKSRLSDVLGPALRQRSLSRAWWHEERRRELLHVAGQAREKTQAARALRSELIKRLPPDAFRPESATVALEAARHNPLVRFLFPGWWSLKGRLKVWYADGLPRGKALTDDLRRLAQFHQHEKFAAQAAEDYAADLVRGEDGKPDWDASWAALNAFQEKLAPLKLPPPVQTALSARSDTERQSLLAELDAVRAADDDCLRTWEELPQVLGSAARLPPMNATDLSRWLSDETTKVRSEREAFKFVVGLLAEGRDVPLLRVPRLLESAGELARLQEQARNASHAAGVGLGVDENDLLDRDWTNDCAIAQDLLRFLTGRVTPIAPHLRLALTSEEVRGTLGPVVTKIESIRTSGLTESWEHLTGELFDPEQNVSIGIVLSKASLDELAEWLAARAADTDRLLEWAEYQRVEQGLARLGAGSILDEIRGGEVMIDQAANAFHLRFYRLWLDFVEHKTPSLSDFKTEDREQLIKEFRKLDRRSVEATAARVRAKLRSGSRHRPQEQTALLEREHGKKTRRKPIRELFAGTSRLLAQLKPCLMMSPLSVSTYLDPQHFAFDLVIFDEASQVRPHDAICAIYRGKQLLVAGDQKQLPPTSFFEKMADADEDADEESPDETKLEDYESVLDVCCSLGLTRRRLRWHYRSKREPLIAFANHFVYGNDLVTFPSALDMDGEPAVRFEFVEDGCWVGGAGAGYNAIEARRVAERVLEHFQDNPDGRSLGVIAFSQKQQQRILDELETLLKDRPELEECLRDGGPEPFFVKNLENVQGDERDVIILSVGYGPDANGKVAMRFGPLNLQGGERRLNVAVTRARHGMLVVSSLRAGDLDLTRTKSEGVRLLKHYLDYAENGPEVLGRLITEAGERNFDSPFEREVAEELRRRGMTVHPQVGCGGFRIDLGLVDPAKPGRYLLGVECDGATYHSMATARDRDRLRQEVLESLGWTICRIWSTDWFRGSEHRERQIQRVLKAYHDAQVKIAIPVTPKPPAQPRPPEPEPDVPIRNLILAALAESGTTPKSNLIRSVAGRMGYQPTPNVSQPIKTAIQELLSEGLLVVEGNAHYIQLALANGQQTTPRGNRRP